MAALAPSPLVAAVPRLVLAARARVAAAAVAVAAALRLVRLDDARGTVAGAGGRQEVVRRRVVARLAGRPMVHVRSLAERGHGGVAVLDEARLARGRAARAVVPGALGARAAAAAAALGARGLLGLDLALVRLAVLPHVGDGGAADAGRGDGDARLDAVVRARAAVALARLAARALDEPGHGRARQTGARHLGVLVLVFLLLGAGGALAVRT